MIGYNHWDITWDIVKDMWECACLWKTSKDNQPFTNNQLHLVTLKMKGGFPNSLLCHQHDRVPMLNPVSGAWINMASVHNVVDLLSKDQHQDLKKI